MTERKLLRVEVDTLVFDLFHTLADPQEHAPPGYARLREVATILGLTEEEIGLWWEQRVPVFVSEPVSPVDDLVELARARRIVMSPHHVAELDRAFGQYQDAALRSPVDGAAEAVSRVRESGLMVSILSNAVTRDVRTFPLSPLAPLVDDACFSCFTGMVKPARAAFTGVLDRLGTVPQRSIYVGDGGSEELRGAKGTGYAAVVCVRGPAIRGGWRPSDAQRRIEEDADVVIDDVAELPELLGIG